MSNVKLPFKYDKTLHLLGGLVIFVIIVGLAHWSFETAMLIVGTLGFIKEGYDRLIKKTKLFDWGDIVFTFAGGGLGFFIFSIIGLF